MVGIFLSGSIVHAFLRSGYRSAPDFIPGEKPPVSLVFPTEIEHYSCFRLYSGLKKKKNRNFLEDSFELSAGNCAGAAEWGTFIGEFDGFRR